MRGFNTVTLVGGVFCVARNAFQFPKTAHWVQSKGKDGQTLGHAAKSCFLPAVCLTTPSPKHVAGSNSA